MNELIDECYCTWEATWDWLNSPFLPQSPTTKNLTVPSPPFVGCSNLCNSAEIFNELINVITKHTPTTATMPPPFISNNYYY